MFDTGRMSALEATAGDLTGAATDPVGDVGNVRRDAGQAATMARLRDLAQAVRPTTLAAERRLPVADALQPLLPLGALQRGTVVAVDGVGATSLALALTSAASSEGSWVGFVGTSTMGWAAAAQAGVDPSRTLVVTKVPVGSWSTVTAALVDAVDLVVVSPTHAVRAADGRRLAARARERGAVLIVLDARFAWPSEPDVRLRSTPRRWHGVGRGHGRLIARSVLVSSEGRRASARRRTLELWLPSAEGVVESPPAPRGDGRNGRNGRNGRDDRNGFPPGAIGDGVDDALDGPDAHVLPFRPRPEDRGARAG